MAGLAKRFAKPTAPRSFKTPRSAASFTADFPLARYVSLLGLQAVLLGFAVIALPRSELPFALSTPRIKTSLDRPEWAWVAALSRDPLAFALWACVGAGVVAVWWAGELGKMVQQRDDWERSQAGKEESEEDKVKRKTEASGRKLKSIKDALLCTLLSTPVLYVLLIALGAPTPGPSARALLAQPATALLALYLAILGVYAPVAVLGAPDLMGEGQEKGASRWVWIRLFVERDLKTPYERALVLPTIGALAGAWLGALPLALDWDRPWQAWPIPPVLGATAGYIAGGAWSAGATAVEALVKVGGGADGQGKKAL